MFQNGRSFPSSPIASTNFAAMFSQAAISGSDIRALTCHPATRAPGFSATHFPPRIIAGLCFSSITQAL